MRIPSNILRKIRNGCGTFAAEESGTGISDYGAIFALLMIVAGIGAGWFLLSSAPAPAPSSAGYSAGATVPPGEQPVRSRSSDPCLACGMG